MAKYNEAGEEMPDDMPVEVPLRLRGGGMTLEERIAMGIRNALSEQAAAEGKETFEEANDFREEDEEDVPPTPYELEAAYDEDTSSYLERLSRAKRARFLESRISHSEKGIDKLRGKEENVGTVNGDRIKESQDVQQRGTEDRGEGAGGSGEKRSEVGGKGGSAG